MPQQTKIFRVFVSSTFSDMRAERKILQEKVFPDLKKLCESNGASFQAVDLRWGVNEEAQLDHKTIDICLSEIARCQKLSPKPNFIILMGDRYGWQPVPSKIPSSEMVQILDQLTEGDKKFVNEWYREDFNALPEEFVLQPREKTYREYPAWAVVESRLRKILRDAVDRLDYSEDQRIKYFASATHQEIIRGALNPPAGAEKPEEHVFAYLRSIRQLPETPEAKDYIDLADNVRDAYCKGQIGELKQALKETLPEEHIYEYAAEWNNGCVIDGIAAFGKRVYDDLFRIVEQQLAEIKEVDEITKEVQLHEKFKNDRIEHFIGQDEAIEAIKNYLASKSGKVLSLIGASGSGKTSIMAKAIEDAISRNQQGGVIIYRFAGTTSGASDTHRLLYQVIQQITTEYGVGMNSLLKEGEDEKKFSTVWGLKDILSRCFEHASAEKPLTIFVDALDQLASDYASMPLDWIPRELPGDVKENVKIVVSALPELKGKLSQTEIYDIPPMSEKDGRQVLERWLGALNRTLKKNKDQEDEVINKFIANGTPLYLKLAFEKAKTWQSYTTDIEIKHDIDGILSEYFDELQKTHGELLVQKFCGYILSGKYQGLTESELLDLFVFDKEHWNHFIQSSHEDHRDEIIELKKLPFVVWSRFFLDLAPYLTEKDATGFPIISFYHRKFAEYAEKRYLHPPISETASSSPTLEKGGTGGFSSKQIPIDYEIKYHKTLADYFETRWQEPYTRALDELPHQRTKAKDVEGIERVLTCLEFIEGKFFAGMGEGLITDYNAIAAGRATPGLPIVTARFHGGRYGIFCPLCLAKSEVEQSRFGSTINCPTCGSGLKINPFSVAAEWLPAGPGKDLAKGKNTSKFEVPKSLNEFSDFVREDAHILKVRPDYIFQQAFSRPDNTAPYRKAAKSVRSLLNWVNKPQRITSCIQTLEGHKSYVDSCACSPDGRHIISASHDKTLNVWDAWTGEELFPLKGHTGGVTSCAYSPDGRRIVSASRDKTLKVWNAETGEEHFPLKGHTDGVTSCAYSPDGRRIISASSDKTLKVWDAETGEELFPFEGHTDGVTSCAYSPDGRRIVSTSWHGTLKVWDAETGHELFPLEGHTDGVTSCAYSPDGRRIVSALLDGTLKVWDVETGEELFPLKGHTDGVTSCAYSPDGRNIVSVSGDRTLKVWDAETGHELFPLKGHTDGVISCAYSPDGRRIVSASFDNTLKVWDAETCEELFPLAGHIDWVTSCAYSPDGRSIVSASSDKTLKVWDAETGEELFSLAGHIDWVTSCAYSPDGRRIISASHDNTLKVWDAETGEERFPLKGHTSHVDSCAYSPDGRRIVSASLDRTLKVWDAETGHELFPLKGHTDGVISCAYSPDGRRIVSASSDNTLKVWDAETCEELFPFEGHTDGVTSCAYSPDGRRIVSTSWDGTLKVWDAETGEELFSLAGHIDWVTSCAYSPDGRRIISASHDNTLKVWDAETGEERFPLKGHTSHVDSCAYSPDGRRIVSTSWDGTLKVWDAETGKELSCFHGAYEMRAVACTTGGVMAGDRRGTLYILKLPVGEEKEPYSTPLRLYRFDRTAWDDQLTAKCEWCGKRFEPDNEIIDTIKGLNSHLSPNQSPAASLPPEAWGDPRLLSDCPHCHKPLRLNPFIVDNAKAEDKQKKTWWKFWER